VSGTNPARLPNSSAWTTIAPANISGRIFRFSVFHSGSIVFSCRAVSVWTVRFDITERARDAGARAVARSQAVHLRLTTSEWEVTEQMREFHFNSGLLVDAEFERRQREGYVRRDDRTHVGR